MLERIAPGEAMTMLVFGGELKARPGSGKALASFLPLSDLSFETEDVGTTTTKTRGSAIFWSWVSFVKGQREAREAAKERRKKGEQQVRDLQKEASNRAEEAANARQISSLQIREPGGRLVTLETGSLGRANAMMQDCARDQLIAWGIDPAVEDKIVRPARNDNLARLFSYADYPRSAMRDGAQSVIQARLNIGADGRVTKCTSLTIFSAPDFPEVVCKKLQTARYEPAELADGTKVPSYAIATIKFVLP